MDHPYNLSNFLYIFLGGGGAGFWFCLFYLCHSCEVVPLLTYSPSNDEAPYIPVNTHLIMDPLLFTSITPLLSITLSGSGDLSCIPNLNKSSLFSFIVTDCFLSGITIVSGCFLLFHCQVILVTNFSQLLVPSMHQ